VSDSLPFISLPSPFSRLVWLLMACIHMRRWQLKRNAEANRKEASGEREYVLFDKMDFDGYALMCVNMIETSPTDDDDFTPNTRAARVQPPPHPPLTLATSTLDFSTRPMYVGPVLSRPPA